MNPIVITLICAGLLAGCATSPQQTTTPPVEPPGVSIHQAAWKGDTAAIEQHHAADTDMNLRNKWNATPLHYAARAGQAAAADLLVAKGANPAAKNNEGITPLHYSASGGRQAIASLLIANGADVNARDAFNFVTPLDLLGPHPCTVTQNKLVYNQFRVFRGRLQGGF